MIIVHFRDTEHSIRADLWYFIEIEKALTLISPKSTKPAFSCRHPRNIKIFPRIP